MNFPKREDGQGLVEYALILALVAIVVIVILIFIGPQITVVFAKIMGGFNGFSYTNVGNEAIVLGLDLQRTESGGACDYTVDGEGVAFLSNGDLVREGTYTLQAQINGGAATTVASGLTVEGGSFAPLSGPSTFTGLCGKVTFTWQ